MDYNTRQDILKSQYGNRPDGTEKGLGWGGEFQNSDGSVSTEFSIGVNIDGQEILLPLITPSSTPEEVRIMQQAKDPGSIPKHLIDKAIDHALGRIKQGQSPFKGQE
jgi:hypothetical protein